MIGRFSISINFLFTIILLSNCKWVCLCLAAMIRFRAEIRDEWVLVIGSRTGTCQKSIVSRGIICLDYVCLYLITFLFCLITVSLFVSNLLTIIGIFTYSPYQFSCFSTIPVFLKPSSYSTLSINGLIFLNFIFTQFPYYNLFWFNDIFYSILHSLQSVL